MSSIVIKAENLGKKYTIGHQAEKGRYTSLRDVLMQNARTLWSKTKDLATGKPIIQGDTMEEVWALKDVNFEIKRGDAVGIIGRNGAGKSTLLKILSRITEPTQGRVEIKGRVASLLEVGTGFHPELTGRENIFLNGAILGMSRKEIQHKFDEIVNFAEVEKFLDTPVKRYSSGMYVRLAFAVAAHLEPEILVIDEVLAVGDVQFQKKCLGKMERVASQGRTVLFVSHNIAAVERLTKTVILLDRGQLKKFGPANEVIEAYLERSKIQSAVQFDVENTFRKFPGNGKARVLQLRFERDMPQFGPQEAFEFVVRVHAYDDAEGVRISMTIFANDGNPVGSCFAPPSLAFEAAKIYDIRVVLPCPRLAPGSYFCGISVGTGDHTTGVSDYDVVLDTLHFDVRPIEGEDSTLASWQRAWGSVVFKPLSINTISTAARFGE